jgi:hypothetical protein
MKLSGKLQLIHSVFNASESLGISLLFFIGSSIMKFIATHVFP